MNNEIKLLIELIGGEENVSMLSHCMTRLRFILKDESLANVEELEKLKIVKGTFTQAGQFQLVIGNDVANVYKEIVSNYNIEEANKEEVKSAAAKEMNPLQKVAMFLAEIFAPIIPAIIVGGLILGFRNMIELPLGIFGGTALTETHQFWAGVDSFLWLIGEAIFQFLPVHVAWSAYKRMGGTPVLGIVIGITLVSPQLVNAYSVAGMVANGETIPVWDFGFAQIQMIGYQAQVIPALLVGMFGGKLEVMLAKRIPSYIQMIVVPFVVLIVTVLLANVVIGPFGWWLGTLIAKFVIWLFTTLGAIGGLIFGFFYAPLVITGLHHTTNAIDMQIIAETGTTPLWPLIALSNIAQGSAVLAMVFIKKDADSRELSIPATISAYLGVTEPAMFGVNLKYTYPFLCGMIGSSLAGAYSTFAGVEALSIGVGGYPGILSIQPGSMFNFFIAMVIATVVPFVLTITASKRKQA
ncbi:PTS system trehalose-specific EIIBC component [Mollicutes bacterium LVI A0078]|nr:PTS system trehalose-specific EIIBC component [Mollicutes bacterium LVI A0075]WOO90188.1 PTS system trehalose-specific EIIBC component [Mollicutes bacterium LVI A0078]